MINNYFNLTKSYAKALFNIANKFNFNLEYLLLLENLNNLIQHAELKSLVANNLLPYQAKAEILHSLINYCSVLSKIINADKTNNFASVIKLFNNLITLLSQKKHLLLIPKIFALYTDLYLSDKCILKVHIITVNPLNKEQQGSLETQLYKYFKQKLLFSYDVDQSIIAGLIIKYKDKIIDFSFRDKLAQLKETLQNN